MYVAACCSRQLSAGVQGFFALIDLPRTQILSAGFRHCWFSSRGSALWHLLGSLHFTWGSAPQCLGAGLSC